jgi:hypothetical protein
MEPEIMNCCGQARRIVKKGKNIAKGTMAHMVGIKYEFTDGRIRVCRGCEYNTWMKKIEYAAWLFRHGIEVLTNFDDLTKLPMLPKQNTGNTIYCRLCKCEIPKKARVKDEKCPKDKWDK